MRQISSLKETIVSSLEEMIKILEEKNKKINNLEQQIKKICVEKDAQIYSIEKELKAVKYQLEIEKQKSQQLQNKTSPSLNIHTEQRNKVQDKKIKNSNQKQKSETVDIIYELINNKGLCRLCNGKIDIHEVDVAYFSDKTSNIVKGYMEYELFYCKNCKVAYATKEQLSEIKIETWTDTIKINYDKYNNRIKNKIDSHVFTDSHKINNKSPKDSIKQNTTDYSTEKKDLCLSCKSRNECMRRHRNDSECIWYIKGTASIDYSYK